MNRAKKSVKVTTLGFGLLAALAALAGCASGDETGSSGDGRDEVKTGTGVDQSLADGAGAQAPLEKKSFDFPIKLTAHNSLNLADELKKAVGANELTFANGAAKVSLDPSSVITLDEIGIGGAIQYTQGALKKHLSLLEGHVSAKATAKIKANFEYTASFSGKESKDFHMDFGTPLDKTLDIQWTDGGVVHKFPVNVTITTGATVGCDATANADAHASLGAELDFQYKGGITYHNESGGTPVLEVPLSDLFSVESTPPADMVGIKPLDMGTGSPTYFMAQGDVKGTASCWIRPEVTVNLFKFIGVAAGMSASIEAQAGATAKASQEGATVPASAEFDWVVTPKLTLEAWGTAGIGTTQVQTTSPFKLGEFKYEKPYAGKFEGQVTFDPKNM
jgi:hypothetical protein